MARPTYSVLVGNVGEVQYGHDGIEATRVYLVYLEQSKSGYGRAAGESVALLKDGEIIREYRGIHADHEG